MSAELDWDQSERPNGSILCEKFLKHGKCSRNPCKWKHNQSPEPNEARPLCPDHIRRRGGCSMGKYCPLSHERPDIANPVKNTINNLPLSLVKEVQPNGRPAPKFHTGVAPGMSHHLGAGISLGAGNDNRANVNTMSAARLDLKQRRDATVLPLIGKNRHEERESNKAQNFTETLSSSSRDGGVPLGVPSLNAHEVGKVMDVHNAQNWYPMGPALINERMDKADFKNGNIQHDPVAPYRKYSSQTCQVRLGNGQQIHPPLAANRPTRDEIAMTRGPNSSPYVVPRNRSIVALNQMRNETTSTNKDMSTSQERVMNHDPKFPTMTERHGEARLPTNIAYRASISNGPSKDTTPTSAKVPRRHGGGLQSQEGLDYAPTIPQSDIRGGKDSKKPLGPGFGNNSISVPSTQNISKDAKLKLEGGGVALENFSQTNHTSEDRNGSVRPETLTNPVAATKKLVRGELNANRSGPVKNQGDGSLRHLAPSTTRPPRGTGGGDEVYLLLMEAMRKSGRAGAGAGPRQLKGSRSRLSGSHGSVVETNGAVNSNFKELENVSPIDGASSITGKSIGGGLSSNGILAASSRNQATTSPTTNLQTRKTKLTEISGKSKNLGLNEMEDSEGGAKIDNLEHVEHEEGGTGKNNEPVAISLASPVKGIQPPVGQKKIQKYPAVYIRGYNNSTRRLRWDTQNTTRPELNQQFGPRNLVPHYQSLGYGHGVTAVPKGMVSVNLPLNSIPPPKTGIVPSPARPPSSTPLFNPESTFRNHNRDSAIFCFDKSTQSPQELSSNSASELAPLYQNRNQDQLPPTMFSYETLEISMCSQAGQDNPKPNRRSYTPVSDTEPDYSAHRPYYDEERIKARASDMSRDSWEESSRLKRQKSVDFKEFIKGDSQNGNTQDKSPAPIADLQNSTRNPKEAEPMAEPCTFQKTLPISENRSKKGNLPVAEKPPVKKVPTSEGPPKKKNFLMVEQPSGGKSPSAGEKAHKKRAPPMAEQVLGKKTPLEWEGPPKKKNLVEQKTPSAWEKPLVKEIIPKPDQETCWLCKRYHQHNEECKADSGVVEPVRSRHGWASTIDTGTDWNWQNQGNGDVRPWSNEATTKPAISVPRKYNLTKLGHAPPKERPPKEFNPDRKVERTEEISGNSSELPKSERPRSIMFNADGNHFGRYYDRKFSGIRKLSEDTLHMIFSYVADGLMPEDQMKMKNVHIGSNFRLDAGFTTTRYRRLKSVLRSCHYWRHLSQHILYKYVNLDQFLSFKGFVRTVSEDAELGRMVCAVKINIQGGASYTSHDNRISGQEFSGMPKSSDSAQLFTVMMESCPELQILSVNMYGSIRGFNLVLTKFPKMREVQIMDDSSKGMVAHNLWQILGNYPNLEKFRIFHSEENGATNFDSLKIPTCDLFKGNHEFILKALTMERAPELSDKILGAFASRLKQLTHLVIVDCKLVTSAGLARAIQRMPDPSQLTRLIYYVWVDPFGKATSKEMASSKNHLCSAVREYCTNLTYLNWKPYRICGDLWKDSNFHLLKRCRIEPMVFKDCSKELELRNHSKFMDAYRQARGEERLPELAEDRVVFDFYF